MKFPKRVFRALSFASASAAVTVLLSSCNAYQGFASPSTDEEYVQEGQKCLREGNYTCAIESYSKIGDTDLKNEKLCLGQLTRAGLGISTMLDSVASSSAGSGMLGKIANNLLPYSTDKELGAAGAVTECNKLATIANTEKASFLRVIAYLTDCAVRIAKTDTLVASSESASSCNSNIAGNGDGEITSQDIAANLAAPLSGSNHGMCEFDAQQCATDMQAASALSGGLGGGLAGVADNLSDLPVELTTVSAPTTTVRAGVANTL